jgi:hypothetical protein
MDRKTQMSNRVARKRSNVARCPEHPDSREGVKPRDVPPLRRASLPCHAVRGLGG